VKPTWGRKLVNPATANDDITHRCHISARQSAGRDIAARGGHGCSKSANDVDGGSGGNAAACKNTAADVDARPGHHAYGANVGLRTKCTARDDDIAAERIRAVLRTVNVDVPTRV